MHPDGRYQLRYALTPPEAGAFTKADADGKDAALTDALFMASVLFPPDGSLSVLFWSFDGRKKADPERAGAPQEMDDVDWFRVWMMLTIRLAKSRTLSKAKLGFMEMVAGMLQKAMANARLADS